MSIKLLLQILISLIIILILSSVYLIYFDRRIVLEDTKDLVVEEAKDVLEETKDIVLKKKDKESLEIDQDINKEKKTKEVKKKSITSKNENKIESDKKTYKKENQPKIVEKEKVIKKEKKEKVIDRKPSESLSDIEYLTTDNKGNRYKILAKSAETNQNNSNILDMIDVKGRIDSDKRATIFIVSDFGEYNSSNSDSKFYQNVVINYEDKEITCDNFDLDMQTNLAIAYNNVVVTDPTSVMYAGQLIVDLKTKDININPENLSKTVSGKVITD